MPETPPLNKPKWEKPISQDKQSPKVQTQDQSSKYQNQSTGRQSEDISKVIIATIKKSDNLKDYDVKDLVEQAEELGKRLKEQDLKARQIRKFLDAVKQLKIKLAISDFAEVKSEIILLKPKLAYATAKHKSIKKLENVLSVAIDLVHDKRDFERLVQIIESIISYHKAGD